ncbi:MAG: DUF1839 family protein [Steroidobacteraceae bacterium]
MSWTIALPHLVPADYRQHRVHQGESVWVEKNCYVDLWIELVHALGLDPVALMPFTVAIDFEGDQWTFYKPSLEELYELYGINVQELNVWRPLLDHSLEHLAAGKLISTEADAYWLPDTAGTDYRRQHTKTTIVLERIDADAQRLHYFHNAGYYELGGEDFVQLFRIGFPPDPAFMPLYAEFVRVDRIVRHPEAELARISLRLLERHAARRPADNPVARFRERFERDLPRMQEIGLAHYHAWAFGTIRQLGSAAELAATNLAWLAASTGRELQAPATAYATISAI